MNNSRFLSLTLFSLLFVNFSAYSANTFTALGPTFIEESGVSGRVSIIFKGHNNHNIWQFNIREYSRYSTTSGPTTINDGLGNFAFTSAEPSVAYIQDWNELRAPILIFRGHNNRRIWYTYKRGGQWQTPRSIDNLRTNYTPAIVNYFDISYDNQIIAYTKDDNSIVLRKGSIYDNNWSGEIRLPGNPKTTRMGPVLFVAHDRVYVFWRGEGDDARIHYAYSREFPTIDNWGWQKKILPRAFTGNYDSGSYQFSPVSIEFYGSSYLLVAYKGHNNNGIFLRMGGLGNWHKLGQVPGVYTLSKPAIINLPNGDTYLAFKSIHSHEICVGELDISPPRWTSIREDKPDLNCGE